METIGTIYKILQQKEITLGDGSKIMKGGFVIIREGKNIIPVAFDLIGDERLALLSSLDIGMTVKVDFIALSIEGRNGNYLSSLICNEVFPLEAETATMEDQAEAASDVVVGKPIERSGQNTVLTKENN